MGAHAQDAGVFIRSMATRGHLGGLARATSDLALILDAAGKDIVMVETVGVGQDEIDIVRTADISIVVLVPGAGDDVQAIKAGVMEIADIYVVNKADSRRRRPDGEVHRCELMRFPDVSARATRRPPILKTEATTGAGARGVMGDCWPVPRAHEGPARRASAGTSGNTGYAICSRTRFMESRPADAAGR